MLWIDPLCWIFWAVLLMVLPLNWLVAAAASACVHELFHAAAIMLLGGRVLRVTIKPSGAVMDVHGVGGLREALCALTGPAGSFLLVFFLQSLPMLALCGLLQGIYNLLPIYPLDGGRALRCIRSHFRRIRKRP